MILSLDDCLYCTTIHQLEDTEKARRPRIFVMEVNVIAVKKCFTKTDECTCHQNEKNLGLNASTIRSMLKGHLHMTKLCCLWVSKDDQRRLYLGGNFNQEAGEKTGRPQF